MQAKKKTTNTKKMKINIAKSSGFCFGVRRAINTCLNLSSSKKSIFVLGDIVHNNFVVRKLSQKGNKKISKIKKTKNSILIISAHGAAKRVFTEARQAGYKIVDATCPKVKNIYKIVRRLEKTNQIIIIGDKNHEEVRGIAGQLEKKPITIESPYRLPLNELKRITKAAVVTQSTQTMDNINKIMRRLKQIIPQIKLYNTLCRTTLLKQREIKTLPMANDIVLIIGSSTSANTRRLFEISRLINKKTYWIENSRNLKTEWFKKAERVGIMAGASTPDEIVKEIVKELTRISHRYPEK